MINSSHTRNWEDVQGVTERMATEDILKFPQLKDESSEQCYPCTLIHRCA